MKLRQIGHFARVSVLSLASLALASCSSGGGGSPAVRTTETPVAACEDLPALDWRGTLRASPVKDQTAACNSCWAFATLAAYEDSYYRKSGGMHVDASEQQLLDCAGGELPSCGAGVLPVAFVRSSPLAKEADYPYVHVQGQCRTAAGGNVPSVLRAMSVTSSSNATADIAKPRIKRALCQTGAVATLVNATPEMDAFHGDVFDQPQASPIVTHALAIVGWDDAKQSWLVKNSRGTSWGTGGYMWVRYTTNGIGRNTVSVEAGVQSP